MPVYCPNCGDLHPDGTLTCTNCGRPIPAQTAPEPARSPRDLTPEQRLIYARMVFRYTIVPIALVVIVMCIGFLVCSSLFQ
jgi:uncharacterized membrane protein YvbJ